MSKWMCFILLAMVATLTGCAGIQNTVDLGKGPKIDVAMSESLFLTPTDAPKTVYVQVQNTTAVARAKSLVMETITQILKASGYLVVDFPPATNILQVSARYAGEYKDGMDFGGTLTGAGLGALAGVGLTNNPSHMGRNAAAGSLAAAAIGLAFDIMTREQTYVVLLDFQLTENLSGHKDYTGHVVKKSQSTVAMREAGGLGSKQNTPEVISTTKEVTSSNAGTKIHQASVAAKAKKLAVADGDPTEELIRAAAAQIAGIF